MPESLLTILKFCFLALLYLFFLRVLRAVWAELSPGRAVATPAAPQKTRGSARGGPPTKLRVVAPAEKLGRVYELGDELTVGRAAGCQVNLDATYVSQLHARVFRRDGQLYVEDLGSTNGTYLNRRGTRSREKVSGSLVVRPGDRVMVGKTVLEVTR